MSDLPPLDQPQAYVVVGPNDQRGPYTMELLISEAVAGRLSDETPVWWPGLGDWTTLGGHPAVAAELASRRGQAVAAPAWAEPTKTVADPFSVAVPERQASPLGDQFAPQVEAAEPTPDVVTAEVVTDGDPGPVVDDGAAAEDAQAGPGTTFGDSFPADGEEPVDAEVVEVDVLVIEDGHSEVFAALVARSSVRARIQDSVDSVNDGVVDAVVAGVQTQGAALSERVETDRGTELRFDGANGDLVVVSLGRADAVRPEDLRDDHIPVTASYRSASRSTASNVEQGAHGEVVVAADEWTGQSTSTVSLFLPLGDYLDDELRVDGDALARDAAATVAVLRSRLA